MSDFLLHALVELGVVLVSGAITGGVGLLVKGSLRNFRAGMDESLGALSDSIEELKQDVKEMRELSGDHAVQIGIHAEAIRTIRDEIAGMRQRSSHG